MSNIFFFFLNWPHVEGIAANKLRSTRFREMNNAGFIHLLSFQEISINVVVALDASRIAFQTDPPDDNNPSTR